MSADSCKLAAAQACAEDCAAHAASNKGAMDAFVLTAPMSELPVHILSGLSWTPEISWHRYAVQLRSRAACSDWTQR